MRSALLVTLRSFTAPGAFRKAASGPADWHTDRSFISSRPARARYCGLPATLGYLSLRLPSHPDMPTPKHPILAPNNSMEPTRPAECLALARY